MTVDQIVRDLRLFADPATPFDVVQSNDGLEVSLTRGSEKRYFINLKTGSILARHSGNKRYSSLASLLASAEFADIRALRASQHRILTAKQEMSGNLPLLDSEGVLTLEDGAAREVDWPAVRTVMAQDGDGQRLSVTLIDGPAGIGKTSLIERLTLERAAPSSPEPPLLHVTSGGSRLTDLNRALAYSLQLIRSSVTFDQVPVLARLGVLQIAIDGFDELVDPEGYKDAWSALRAFLVDVGKGGPIILAGRDTFFDQQKFKQLLIDRLPDLAVRKLSLHPVSPHAGLDYLAKAGWSGEDIREAKEAGWFRVGSYSLRPFFLSQIASASGWKDLSVAHGSPQSFLVERMIRREAELLANTVKLDVEAAIAGLKLFFASIAEDMAIQQTDSVDEDYISFACEAAFTGLVDQQDLGKLVHKSSSFALLESGGTTGERRFPHSEFQDQFVARAIYSSTLNSAASVPVLRLATITGTIAEAFSDLHATAAPSDAGEVARNLAKLQESEAFGDKISSNVGALRLATLSRIGEPVVEISNGVLYEAKLIGTVASATLNNVEFGRLDMRSSDMREVVFKGCTCNVASVDENTVFGATAPKILELNLHEGGRAMLVRVPEEVQAWLVRHMKCESLETQNLPFFRYFERLCRAFLRQRQIKKHDSDASFSLISGDNWEKLKEILGDRLVESVKVVGGPSSAFYRLIDPEALLDTNTLDEGSQRIRRLVAETAREFERAANNH